MMKFIVDDKIPYIKGALEPYGKVLYLPGSETTAELVRDADAIVTRTRTVCNERLLSGSSVKFIATATIGFDHIDTKYCRKAGILWVNAPGCNSGSVEQYVTSLLFVLANKKGFELKGKTIGVVGVGHVGSKVAKIGRMLGMNVLMNDPPRQRIEGKELFCCFDEIAEKSDIITFHVPLKRKGDDATYHMADSHFFQTLKKKPFVINTCRGEILDSISTKAALKKGLVSGMAIDCWENEPLVDLELLEMVDLATPHIAGYSKDGKAKGTTVSVQAISRFFGLGIDHWQAGPVDLPANTVLNLNGQGLSEEEIISRAVLFTYDIRMDDAPFRKNPELFEQLRGDYPVRREYPVYTLNVRNVPVSTLQKLETMGFRIG